MSPTATSDQRTAQEGFTLAALIVILTIISIVIAYTVPQQWSLVMRRERDRQTIFLMKQYAIGIDAFQRKHNSFPVSLQQLQDARKPRFLRGDGKWPCPLTGGEKDWILVPPNAVMPGGSLAPQNTGPIIGGAPKPKPKEEEKPAPQPGQQGPAKLNKEASPKDYVGPFVAVRPNATGKSFIALNGAEDYSEWVYTVEQLRNERQARAAALALP